MILLGIIGCIAGSLGLWMLIGGMWGWLVAVILALAAYGLFLVWIDRFDPGKGEADLGPDESA